MAYDREKVLKERRALRLGEIINLAAGGTHLDSSLEPKDWNNRFRLLKDDVTAGRPLPDKNAVMPPSVGTSIPLDALYKYAAANSRLEWLSKFSAEWAGLSGITPPLASTRIIKRHERDCEVWLTEIMRREPRRPKSKPQYYRGEAQQKFPTLSRKAFNRAWENAITASGNIEFRRHGPVKRS